ncbi:alpha/beta hydrolase-fold protein [Flavihumibacter sp. UBA7668]|uniref:carboxylesterase family protein n=1 Tax=Flavihumibacter sp. UBA7668 TaxID=1946542 RepID=UPI0025C5D227|nr:alpha/beta hydrolase-fold protein [Flavihumibacter sp. UBA7668]
MKFFTILLAVSTIVGTQHLFAQTQEDPASFNHIKSSHFFTNGLIAPFPSRYGREAVYSDELAYLYFSKALAAPKEGLTAGTNENGQPIIWESMDLDSTGRLRPKRGRALGGAPAGPGVRAGATRGGLSWGSRIIYLSYQSPKAQTAILSVKGNSSVLINGEMHTGDPYNMGFLYIPVQLGKGLNEFYLRGSSAIASLLFPSKPVQLQGEDMTLPHIVPGVQTGKQEGAVVVVNTENKPLKGLRIQAIVGGNSQETVLPDIPAMSSRKVAFVLDGTTLTTKGTYTGTLNLLQGKSIIDQRSFPMEVMGPGEAYSSTFTSEMDGSLQYYSVRPQTPGSYWEPGKNALFLSVHGAGVEAISQARAYKSKDWGTLVAATNRRPRGFNWEDWGRLDAMEVLNIAKARFRPDPSKIYLTGHSMGGHGTWFLGATYPDKWAAIAPCAGYPTMKGYGSADGLIPDSSGNLFEQRLLRSSNQSDVIKLATNYKHHGVYIFHGDDDRTVPVRYARQMREILGGFQPDFVHYEYPGGSHWFGDHSVDWKPLFDYFQWHQRLPDSSVSSIDFTTAHPGISASSRWASILQQQEILEYSRMQLNRNRSKGLIEGNTKNIHLLELDLSDFSVGSTVEIKLDSMATVKHIVATPNEKLVIQKAAGGWQKGTAPTADQKGPHRYGTLKEAFNHRMVYVVGTIGNKEETAWNWNKARYDAETWYYRGNGAVDIITDKEYSLEKYNDRGVILIGNKTTNAAWPLLLADCPIQVERDLITAGNQRWEGEDLATYFVWPLKNSSKASVAVLTGTGMKGNQAAYANQYFAGASGFPDYMIFSFDMLKEGAKHLKLTGFFDLDWKL